MKASPGILRAELKKLRVTAEERQRRNQQIAQELLRTSTVIDGPDFQRIDPSDIEQLFRSYDLTYFDGLLTRTLGETPLKFRVSSRMTRAGGKTTSWRRSRRSPADRFEIAVSSTLLLQTFADERVDRTVLVTGLECHNRLDALMRVMEHELVHLSELLGWNASSCTRDRFQTIAWQVFGHTDHRHSLITPREHAAASGVRPGAYVTFEFKGKKLSGLVNRITRRATVLVPSADGELFSDGRTYARFYVPVSSLEPVEPGP